MRTLRAASVACMALSIIPLSAKADSVAEFYRGKTLQVVIPAGPGGSVGVYARLIGDFLGRHLPGTPSVILVNRPGAGGVTAASFIYNVAPKDGTVIGNVLAPSILVPLLQEARYDPTKFQWLASLTARPGVASVWHAASATTLDDARRTVLNFGSTGIGAGNYQIPTLANAVLGTKIRVITGYSSGGDINLGIERREIDGRFNYWSGWTSERPHWIQDRKLVFLFRTGPRAAGMPDVPALRDLVSGEERQMVRLVETPDDIGVGCWVAPGVPADRVAALRKAFSAMMQDEKFLAEADKRRVPIAPISAAELEKIVADMYSTSPAVVDRIKKMFQSKQ